MAIGTPTSLGTAAPAVTGTSHAISAGSIPAAADTVAFVVATYVSTSGTIPTATLAGGGLTWSKVEGTELGFVSSGVGWAITIFSADASAGMSASTLTLTTSTSCFGANLSALYNTGLQTSAGRVDVVDGQGVTTPGSAAWDTTAQTSTVADLFVIGGAINDGSTSNTASGGATELHDFTNTNAWNHATEYKIQSATGSTSLTGTWSAATGTYIAAFASFKAAAGAGAAPYISPLSPAALNGPDAPPGFFEALLLPPAVVDVAPTSLDLDASGGTATASGTTPVLSFAYAPGSGGATAGGSNIVFSDGLTAASGVATAGGGSVTLAATWAITSGGATAGGSATLIFTWSSASGGATAGGGSDTLAFTYAVGGGGATAGGGADTGAFTVAVSSGLATAGGGSDTLTFVYGVAGGAATAGGGDATATTGGGVSASASGGVATAGGGTLTFAATWAVTSGDASAAGGTVGLSIDVPPPPVEPPVVSGPTGGADYGDESAIYGNDVRVVSSRGRGYGWGLSSRVRVVSRPKIRLPRILLPSFEVRRTSASVESAEGALEGWGLASHVSMPRTIVSTAGVGDGHGGEGRALTMDGSPEAEDVLVLSLLGVL